MFGAQQRRAASLPHFPAPDVGWKKYWTKLMLGKNCFCCLYRHLEIGQGWWVRILNAGPSQSVVMGRISLFCLCVWLDGGVTAGPRRRAGAKQTLATGHGLELVSGLIHNVLLSTVRCEVKKQVRDYCAYEWMRIIFNYRSTYHIIHCSNTACFRIAAIAHVSK